jgi:hypothetical protein
MSSATRVHRSQRFCHSLNLSWKTSSVRVFSTACDCVSVISVVSKRRSFSFIFWVTRDTTEVSVHNLPVVSQAHKWFSSHSFSTCTHIAMLKRNTTKLGTRTHASACMELPLLPACSLFGWSLDHIGPSGQNMITLFPILIPVEAVWTSALKARSGHFSWSIRLQCDPLVEKDWLQSGNCIIPPSLHISDAL